MLFTFFLFLFQKKRHVELKPLWSHQQRPAFIQLFHLGYKCFSFSTSKGLVCRTIMWLLGDISICRYSRKSIQQTHEPHRFEGTCAKQCPPPAPALPAMMCVLTHSYMHVIHACISKCLTSIPSFSGRNVYHGAWTWCHVLPSLHIHVEAHTSSGVNFFQVVVISLCRSKEP